MEAERGIVKSFVLPPAVCASAEQFAPLAVISRVRRSGMGVNCGCGPTPETVRKFFMRKRLGLGLENELDSLGICATTSEYRDPSLRSG